MWCRNLATNCGWWSDAARPRTMAACMARRRALGLYPDLIDTCPHAVTVRSCARGVRHHCRELHKTPVRTVRRYCWEAWVGVISGGPIFRSHAPSNELGCAYAVGSLPLEHTMQKPIAVVEDCKQEWAHYVSHGHSTLKFQHRCRSWHTRSTIFMDGVSAKAVAMSILSRN